MSPNQLFIKSTTLLTLTEAFTKTIGLLITIILAHKLSIADFGIFNFFISFTWVFFLLTLPGIDTFLLKHLSQLDPTHQTSLITISTTLKLFLHLLSFLSIISVHLIIQPHHHLSPLIYISLSFVCQNFSSFLFTLSRSLMRPYPEIISKLIFTSLFLSIAITIPSTSPNLNLLCQLYAAASFIYLLTTTYYTHHLIPLTLIKPPLHQLTRLVKSTNTFTLISTLTLIQTKISLTFLGFTHTPYLVGNFATAWIGFSTLDLIIDTSTANLLPFLSQHHRQKHRTIAVTYLTILLSIPLIWLIAPLIINPLFSHKYPYANNFFRLLLFPTFFRIINKPLSNLALSHHLQRPLAHTLLLSTGMHLSLLFLFKPLITPTSAIFIFTLSELSLTLLLLYLLFLSQLKYLRHPQLFRFTLLRYP